MYVGEGQAWLEGEGQAWAKLSNLVIEDVCRNAQVDFGETVGCYSIPFYSEHLFVDTQDKRLFGNATIVATVLNEMPHYSRLSALWYLIKAKDIPLSGTLISPREIDGGIIFLYGSHQLPLRDVAVKYGDDLDGFIRRGEFLGGRRQTYGDMSIMFFPFPRVPVTLIIWKADEENPAQASILFDATCPIHLPLDIVWSTAMMSILLMLD